MADERLRIARDLHDTVAHAMSVIAVRSGVARMVLDTQPDEVRDALGIIEKTSKQALAEMRLLVGVLRQSGDGPELSPAPGLADLPGLLDQISQAGVNVDLDIDSGSDTPALPAGVDLSAYRIIQEALTNVVRHAGPTTPASTVRHRHDQLEIQIDDDGAPVGRPPNPTPAGQGHGLVGMRERVNLFGGDLSRGPRRRWFPGVRQPAVRRGDPVTIGVVIADDQALLRGGFRVLVDSAADIEVVGEAATAPRRSTSSRRLGPTSCSWTSACPAMDGIEATRADHRRPATRRRAGAHPDHLRPRRVRLRRAARRRERVPAQGHATGGAARAASGSWPPATRCSPRASPVA